MTSSYTSPTPSDPRFLPPPLELQVVSKTKPVFFVVHLQVPEEARERMPFEELYQLDGPRILRFYCQPQLDHLIEHKGHYWRVTEMVHHCEVKGSRRKARLPDVLAEYEGRAGDAGPEAEG